MIWVGIDPGLDGAVVAIWEKSQHISFYDTPTIKVKGRRRYIPSEMVAILHTINSVGPDDLIVMIEAVHSQPRDGTVGAFSFGYGCGLWEGILAALKVPYELIPPQTWRKAMLAGMPSDKAASIVKAHQLFPQANSQLTLKKHHNRADAILLAEFGRRRYGHRKD